MNGSHGISFVRKLGLIGLMLAARISMLAICGTVRRGVVASNFGVLSLGFAVAHMAELHLRHIYAEKVREKRRLAGQIVRLEERNEQLKAEKERLLYDVQRRGRTLDDDNHSTIRRGLQAGPSDSPPPSLPPGAPSSTAGSSTAAPLAWEEAVRHWQAENAGGMAVELEAVPRTLAETERENCIHDAGAACNAVVPTVHSTLSAAEARSLCRDLPELAAELMAAEVLSEAAKKEASVAVEAAEPVEPVEPMEPVEQDMCRAPLSELGTAPLTWDETNRRWMTQSVCMVSCGVALPAPTFSAPEAIPGLESSESLELTLPGREQLGLAELAEVAELADGDAVAVLQSILSPVQEVQGIVGSPAQAAIQQREPVPPIKLTPKQALHVARHRIQMAHTDAKVYEVVRTLAIALGASRPEAGTIRALHAVLIQLAWPGTSNMEACTFTDASMSNFARWRRRVAKAENAN